VDGVLGELVSKRPVITYYSVVLFVIPNFVFYGGTSIKVPLVLMG
jgi:hypothetical protein